MDVRPARSVTEPDVRRFWPTESDRVPPAAAPPVDTGRRLARLFLIGAALFVLRLVVSAGLLRGTLRRAWGAPAWVTELVDDLPRVVVSRRAARPFCCGLGRGTIVLPAHVVHPAHASKLEVVLRHERAHLIQRHPRARLVAALGAPLLYWQPLYWWLARELRHSAELLADDMAVEHFDKRRYVEELLALAEHSPRALASETSGLGVLGSRQDFLTRMETLLMRRSKLATRSSGIHIAVRTLCAAGLLGSVSIAWGRPVAQDALPPTENALYLPLDVTVSLEVPAANDVPDHRTLMPGLRDEAPVPVSRTIGFEVDDAEALGHMLMMCGDLRLELQATENGARLGRLVVSNLSDRQHAWLTACPGLRILQMQVSDAPTPWTPSMVSRDGTASMRAELDTLVAQVRTLTQLCNDMLDSQRMLQKQLETQQSAAGASLELEIVGTITVGSARDQEHVQIDVGSADGVRDGMTFEVYRGSTYKGRVRAKFTAPGTCMCSIELLTSGQTLESGDRVTTRLGWQPFKGFR